MFNKKIHRLFIAARFALCLAAAVLFCGFVSVQAQDIKPDLYQSPAHNDILVIDRPMLRAGRIAVGGCIGRSSSRTLIVGVLPLRVVRRPLENLIRYLSP